MMGRRHPRGGQALCKPFSILFPIFVEGLLGRVVGHLLTWAKI